MKQKLPAAAVVFALCALVYGCGNPIIRGLTDPLVDRWELDQMNLADFGTKDHRHITTITTTAANLENVLINDITDRGNYIVNVSGSAFINYSFVLTDFSDCTISLRGEGAHTTIITNGDFIFGNVKLILRDITIKNGIELYPGATLVMESGSAFANVTGFSLVIYVGTGASFIMNGGTIYGNEDTIFLNGLVIIEGRNAHFEKNRGAIIYGTEAPAGLRNIPGPGGHVIQVYGTYSGGSAPTLRYRDTTVGANETLSVTKNSAGNGIVNQTGHWQQ